MLEITIQRYALRCCARAHFHALPFELRKYVTENFRRTLIFVIFSSCWGCGRIIRKFAQSENYPLYGNYCYTAVSDNRLNAESDFQRGCGGVAIIWNKNIRGFPISAINSENICGLRIFLHGDVQRCLSILGIYMPKC